jgi:recombination protein RecR
MRGLDPRIHCANRAMDRRIKSGDDIELRWRSALSPRSTQDRLRMTGPEIEKLIQLLARLPGLGPRSARRAALYMLKRRDVVLLPLAEALREAAARIKTCAVCGNLDTSDPCSICADSRRDAASICVVEEVADLWAIERSGAFKGRYHVLGGVLSALEGVSPEDLNIAKLVERARDAREVILATNATVEGQTTAHYITDRLAGTHAAVTRLAHGVPVGGELDYLDDGTLTAALRARRVV